MTERGTVLEVVGSLAIGGAERVAVELAAGLAKRGFRVEMLIAGDGAEAEHSTRGEAESRGIHVHTALAPGWAHPLRLPRIARLFRERGVALLHAHNRPIDWNMAMLGRALGIPTIYSAHLAYPLTLRQRLVYAAAGRVARRVVCVSREVAAHVEASELVPHAKVQVIYNGIRDDLFRPPAPGEREARRAELGWAPGDFVWICAARLHPQKGHEFLLRAMADARVPRSARLALVGDGPLRARLADLVDELGLAGRVDLLGARRDVPELLRAADAYACASMAEGHPLAVLEAMATALPVVAPRLQPIVDTATGTAPYFFGPHLQGAATSHDPRALAQALADVQAAYADHAAIARDARAHVLQAFSLDAMLDAHAALYDAVLRASRGA